MPNPVKWITNVGKSISYSFIDEMKELNPALNAFKEDNGDFVKSVKSTISIKSIKDSSKNLSSNEYFSIAKDTINNLKSDIKTGNLYNREREKKAEDQFASKMMGFDDSDFGFDDSGDMNFNFDEDVTDSIDQSTKSTNDMVDLVGKKTSLAISNAVVGSSEYMAKTSRKNTKILFDQNNILFSKLHSDLGTVNQNIGSILEFNKEATTTHYNNSAAYYSNMTSKMEETTSMLKEMLEMQKEYYGKKNDFNGIYGSNERSYSGISNKGVINLEAFFKNIKGNVKDKLSMLDMLGSMVTDTGMGGMLSASPGKYLTQGLVKMLTPKMLKESMKDFNETLSGVLANAILKINDEAGDFSFKQILASLFKTNESLKTEINPSGYKKDAIPFDGVTKKAITEVIPTYLAKILSAVSNQSETRYDYEKGRFVSMDEIKREYQNIVKNNSKMASWNMSNSMMDLANNTIKFDKDDKGNFISKKQFQKDLEAFFEYQYKNAKVFNGRKENIDPATYGMKGGQKSEISAKLIKQMWNALPNKERMKLAGEILDQRQMQNTTMRDIESNSNSSIINLFNGSGATKTGSAFKSKKASSDSPYANSSKYSGAIIDILGDIRKEVSYIRAYGIGEKNGFSGKSKGKRSKKKSRTTNNYNRTVSFENYNPYDDININDFDEDENYSSMDLSFMNENLVGPDGKVLPPLEKKDNETQEEFDQRVRERFEQIKSGKKKNKGIFGKIADATSGNKLVKSIAGGIDKILEKPAQFLTTVIRKADETVFDLVFGKAGDKENKGILYEMKVGIRKTFTNMGDWLQKNVLDPIKEKFTAKNIKEMGRKFFGLFGIDIDKTVKSVREKLFGVKGEDGKRQDGKKGIFGQFIDDTKDSFKKAFGWFKGTFKEAAEWAGFKGTLNEKGKTKQKKKDMAQDVMRRAMNNEDKRAAQRVHEKNKEKKEEDKRRRTGEEILGQAAAGLRRVPKTGVYALSEGEAVIPPDHDPAKIKRRYANEARAIDRYKKHGGISMFAEGTEGPSEDDKDTNKKDKKSNYDRAKEIYDSIKFEYDDYEEGQAPLGMEIMKQLSNLLKLGKAFAGDVSDKVMSQKDADNKVKEDVSNIFGKVMNLAPEVKNALPNMTVGAVIGSGVSLISGMIGGPLLGAAVGAASGLVIKSKTVQDLLFGSTDKDGNYKAGLIPKNVSDTIKKYVPTMAKGSTLGMITSLIPFVPGGPMAGILLGSAAGVVAKNEKIYNALFGEDSILPDFPNRIKKALPKMGAGAAVGLVAGPFGVATNILLGSAVGFAADSDKFKNVFFGEKDKYGKRVGGIYNTIVDTISAPIKDMTQKFGDWFNETIKRNLNDFFTPLKNSALHAVDTIKDFFKDKINDKIVRPIEEKLKSLLKPFAKLFGFAFNTGKNILKTGIGLPFNMLGGIGRRMTRHQVKNGRAYDMTAAERNEYRRTHKLGIIGRDKASRMDQTLEQMGSEDLQSAKDAIEFLRTGDRDNKKVINENTKKIQNSINANIGKLPAKQQKDIIKYLNKGKYKQAIGYLDKINISDPSAKSALIKDIEASGKEIAKARYAMNYNKNGEYRTKAEDKLKSLGFDTNSLNLRDMSRLLDTELADRNNSDAYEESKKSENFQNDILKDIQEIILQMKMLNKGLLGSDIDVESITTKNLDKKIKKAQDKAEKRNEQQEHIDRGEARTKFGRARQKIFGGIKGAVGHTFNRLGGWVFADNTTEDGNVVDRAVYKGVKAAETLGRGAINSPRRAKRAVTKWAGRKLNKFKGRNDRLRRFMDEYFDDHDVDGQAAEGLYGVPYSGLYALSEGEYVIPSLAEGTELPTNRKNNTIVLRIMMVGDKLRASLGMGKGKKNRRNKNKDENSYQGDNNEKTTTSFYNGLPIKNKVDANGNVEPDTSDAETVNTLRERDEDRANQKGIFDTIKGIPSKIGEIFGIGKKKDKKKDNLLGKILKAAGIAMLAAFFAPKIINFIKKTVAPFIEDTVVPIFKDKILPAMEEKLNNVKNGFLKGFLGDNYEGDNPEGIVGAFGEKIGEGTAVLKSFLTDDVLPWITDKAMPAVGNYLEEKAPEILASAIKNLPETILTVGGIFGKTLNLVFGNKNNSGATNTVDTKNLESGKKTSMTDEKGNKLTKEDIENKNYNSIYNSEGAKGKVNDDGTVTFTDKSNPFVSPLDIIGNAAFHQFIKGKPGKFNKAFQAVMKSKPLEAAKKIPVIKWPLKLFSGISKPLAKGIEWAGNLGSKASTKFAAKFLTETVKTVGENGEEITEVVTKTPKIAKYLDNILGKVKTIVDKLFSNKKSFKKIKELAESLKISKISEWISKFKDNVGKIFAKFTKEAASEASEDVIKQTAKKLNLVLTIATAVLDFIKGADQAESILGVTETSIVEEVIAGLVNAVVNAIPLLSLVPNIVSNITKAIYNLFDDDLEERKKEADKEYQSYKDEGGTYTKEEYLKSKYSTTGKIGLWIEKKKSALFNKFFGKNKEPEGSKIHKSSSKEEHGGSVGGSFAAGGTVPYSGLYALSKGEYVIPRLAEGTTDNSLSSDVQNASKSYSDNIKENVIHNSVGKAMNYVMHTNISDAASGVQNYGDAISSQTLSKVYSKISGLITGLLQDDTVVGTIFKLFNIAGDIQDKVKAKINGAATRLVAKICDKLTEKLTGVAATRFAGYITSFLSGGGVFTIASLVKYFISGMYNTAEIAKILPEDANNQITIVCGLFNAINNLLPTGIIDTDIIFDLCMDALSQIVGNDVLNLNKLRSKANDKIAQYGDNYTLDQYISKYKSDNTEYQAAALNASISGMSGDKATQYINNIVSGDNQFKTNDTNEQTKDSTMDANIKANAEAMGMTPEEYVKAYNISSYAAGGDIRRDGLYALSKGEYVASNIKNNVFDTANTVKNKLVSGINGFNPFNIIQDKLADMFISSITNKLQSTGKGNSSLIENHLQDIYSYAISGNDKFFKSESDNDSGTLKLIGMMGRAMFNPIYSVQKMQKFFISKVSNQLGDGDKVLETFNNQLEETNNYLSGKGSMKNYWNDKFDDDKSMLGTIGKTITTIYKTLQYPMVLAKSLFQTTSGMSSNDTESVDAVSGDNTSATTDATSTSDMNAASDSSASTTVSSTSTDTDKAQSAINKATKKVKDKSKKLTYKNPLNKYAFVSDVKSKSNKKNMPDKYYRLVGLYGENRVRAQKNNSGRYVYLVKLTDGKWYDYDKLGTKKSGRGSGLYVGSGSYDPEPISEKSITGNNHPKMPFYTFKSPKTIEDFDDKPVVADQSKITPVSKNFVSQITGNISTERFNVSADTSRQTVSDSGCAPAVATMVINSLAGQSTIDMNTAVQDALGYKVPNSGVTSEYFDDEFNKYGISTQYIENDSSDPKDSAIVKAIKEKRPTILLGRDPNNKSKNNSPFGSNPHYVVADSISKDNQYIYINDPESRKPKTKYNLKNVLPRVTIGITTSIGRKARNAASKLNTYVGRATRQMVKPKNGDYISKYIHHFESGSDGPTAIGHCGNDGGLSFGSYQMIWDGPAPEFWSKYFASKYGSPTSCDDLKTKWLKAVNDIGKDAFFAKEWDYILNSDYLGLVNNIKSKYGFDPDQYSRAMQDCCWSWAVHRGVGGATKEFGEVASQFNNKPMDADETKLLNACYDVRASHMTGQWHQSIGIGRYGTGADTERTILLGIVGQDPIDHTAPDGTAGAVVGSDNTSSDSGSSNNSSKKSILDVLLAPFDLLASDYGLTGSDDSSSSGGTTEYNSDGISGTVSSDKNIADKQVKVVAQMNSVYGKLKYAQDNAKYPGSRNPDDGSGDCSSTVEWAYKKALGVEVGGWSGEQATYDTTYTVDGGSTAGVTTDESKLQLGDILLYGSEAGSHAEMYFGHGQVLTHGNPDKLGPTTAAINRRADYWGARRLKDFKSSGTSTFDGNSSNSTSSSSSSSSTSSSNDSKSSKKKNKGSGSGLFAGRGSFVSQLDPKYANRAFNIKGDTIKQTIGDSGCAPAAATMVLNDIAGRASMMDSSKLALKYKGSNDGVTADYFSDIYSRNGLDTNYYNNSDQVRSDLRRGKDVVLLGSDKSNTSKSNSPFGPNSHYVVASGMSKDGRNITIKDPEAKKPKKYNADKILGHTKLGIGYGSGLTSKFTKKLKKYIGRGFGSYSGILYVGDSRTEMMADCIHEDGVSFIAKVSQGLAWLKSTAGPEMEARIKSDPNLAVVINMGVNDIYQPDNYIAYYTELKKRNPNAHLFYMSVNPVDNDPNCSDAEVQGFNSKMQSFWGSNYLDVYSYLKSDGYKTTDGTHYDDATSKKIHEKVKSMLSGTSSSTSGSSSSSSDSSNNSVLDRLLGSMDNLAEKYGLVVNVGGSDSSSSDSTSTSGSTAGSDYPKYNLTEDQVTEIATGVTGETGGDNLFESMQEASQMANLNEVTKKRQATGADMLSTLHSGWYASASFTRGVTDTAKDAVRKVFNEGKRTLPRYVTEHDTFPMDITNAKDRSAYQKGDPVSNRYGSNYKFYDFFGQNKEGDISGYFDQDYATYQNDVPWSGTGSGLLNNYPKYKGRGGFNDVMTAFSNYTDQMASSMGLTDSSDDTESVSDSTKSITKKSDGTSDMTKLMKSVIKLLAKVADNTSDISEIVSILSKLVDLQSTQMNNSETKQKWTSLKTDLANKLSSYNKTSTGSGELSNLMNSIESLAME